MAGIGLTALAAIQPLRRALGPSRGLVVRGYLAAMEFVAIGADLATLLVAGWPPVTDAWPRLKPAHAWLNLVGFVSLVIATTLMHFYPTVVGARISAHWSGRLTIVATAVGAALVATGYALGLDLVARLGAAATIAGAAGLVRTIVDRWRHRARWTTDPEWHRFVIGGLTSAVACTSSAWRSRAASSWSTVRIRSGGGSTSSQCRSSAAGLHSRWSRRPVICCRRSDPEIKRRMRASGRSSGGPGAPGSSPSISGCSRGSRG